MCFNCFSYISFDVTRICLVCNRASIDGLTHPPCRGRYIIDGAFSSIAYKGVVKKLVYKFKYKPYLSDLKTVLLDLFYEGLIQQEEFDRVYREKPLLVPIPLHSSKLKSRGYNQAEILALGLSEKLNLNVLNILERVKKTPSQVGLTRKKRKENIFGAFVVKNNVEKVWKSNPSAGGVLLVDDVVTTGSTLLEAAYILKKNGVKKVFGITLAQD